MKQIYFALIGLGYVGLVHATCLSEIQIRALENKEREYLLNRVPPAFEDVLASGDLKMMMQNSTEKTCAVSLRVTLPQQDLLEAKTLLAEQPAKQIMLAAQGYALPETEEISANFELDENKLNPQKKETLQTAPLGKMRAAIELMYAMLTQARAELNGKPNTTKWQSTFKEEQIKKCTNQNTEASQKTEITQACECWANRLEEKVSAKQMRYQAYLTSNPYALATGSSKNYTQINQELAISCGLTGKVNN